MQSETFKKLFGTFKKGAGMNCINCRYFIMSNTWVISYHCQLNVFPKDHEPEKPCEYFEEDETDLENGEVAHG